MGTTSKTAVSGQLAQHAGKYLTFELAGEKYGLEILKVREIIALMNITKVPRMPDFVKGVINLRGKVLPVFDLRLKFGMPAAEKTHETCIIIVKVESIETGLIVDKVLEVLNIAEEDLDDRPSFGADVDTEFILGLAKTNEKVTILLDISKVLTNEDIGALRSAGK